MNKHSLMIALSLFALFGCKKDKFVANKVPVVNAGADISITLPTNFAIVNGAATDADGNIVAYLWSQVSGPSPAVIAEPGSKNTRIQVLIQGRYVFQLMATDNKGATGVDTTAVVVNPSPIQTLTLQPANNPNERTLINYNGVDESGSGQTHLTMAAWTKNSNPYNWRNLLKFDLAAIPSSATIINATLYLYSHPFPVPTGNFVDANFGTSNAMLIQQITSNWTPSTTWANQPSSTTANQVLVPHTTQSIFDLTLDVKNMVANMVNTNSNFGFLLRMQNEVAFNCRIFVASFNTTYTSLRPKLVVVYQP